MFQFTRFASIPYVFRYWYPCGWVSPFRHLRIKAYLPAPRSFSQAITSFVAYHRQGIHHMLLVTWPYNFDFFYKNSPLFCHDLRGLAPRALCRNLNGFFDSTAIDLQWFLLRTIRHYLNNFLLYSKVSFVLTQSKFVIRGTVYTLGYSFLWQRWFDSMNF